MALQRMICCQNFLHNLHMYYVDTKRERSFNEFESLLARLHHLHKGAKQNKLDQKSYLRYADEIDETYEIDEIDRTYICEIVWMSWVTCVQATPSAQRARAEEKWRNCSRNFISMQRRSLLAALSFFFPTLEIHSPDDAVNTLHVLTSSQSSKQR